MPTKRFLAFGFICWFSFQPFLLNHAFAQSYMEDAEVLPKGAWRFQMDDRAYFPTQTRYGRDGRTESAAADFNANLNSQAFTNLALVESAFHLSPGTASLGQSKVTFTYHFNIVDFGLDYGLTDKLTIGVRVPYWFVKNKVGAKLDPSTATVGKNTFLNTLAPLNLNLPIPGFRPTVPLTTNDVQNLIGPGLSIRNNGVINIPGFGFKRLQTWTGDGLSDIEAGFRYQYLNNKVFRLAVTPGIRFPTGKVDDPNNLADYAFGRGAYALLARMDNGFIFIKNLLLSFHAKYDYVLPDIHNLRVPSDANHPLTPNLDRVHRQYGGLLELESNVRYTFLEIWNVDFIYILGTKAKDHASGSKGFNYSSLEDESNYQEQVYRVGVGLSTIPLYQKGTFPVPLTFTLQYRDRFAGNNKLLATKYLRGALNVYF
jgi:hypothetical protein